MRRFVLLATSLLFLNLLCGCQTVHKNGYKPQPENEYQADSSSAANMPSGSGAIAQFKTVEVKPFKQAEGLALSGEFLNYFYNGLSEELVSAGVAGQVIKEGAAVVDADAVKSAVLEGKITEYKSTWYAIIVKSEIKLYRRGDKTLIKTITAEVAAKSSPLTRIKM